MNIYERVIIVPTGTKDEDGFHTATMYCYNTVEDCRNNIVAEERPIDCFRTKGVVHMDFEANDGNAIVLWGNTGLIVRSGYCAHIESIN